MAGPSTIDRVVAGIMGYEPETIILFGSAARGDADEYSDIDLIVIKDTDKRFVQRMVDVLAFIPKDVAVDAIVYTPQEFETMVEMGNPFMEQALGEGKVVYERTSGFRQAEVAPPTKWSKKGGIAFVRRPLVTARRWLSQAEQSAAMTRLLMDGGFWSGACFQAEQTAQMGFKAFLYFRGHSPILTHAVSELAQQCAEEDSDFLVFLEQSAMIEEYYLSTRYPDAVPAPGVPFEMFTEQLAIEALGYAEQIPGVVKAKIEADSGESTESAQGKEES